MSEKSEQQLRQELIDEVSALNVRLSERYNEAAALRDEVCKAQSEIAKLKIEVRREYLKLKDAKAALKKISGFNIHAEPTAAAFTMQRTANEGLEACNQWTE